jgi:hypothetical protein
MLKAEDVGGSAMRLFERIVKESETLKELEMGVPDGDLNWLPEALRRNNSLEALILVSQNLSLDAPFLTALLKVFAQNGWEVKELFIDGFLGVTEPLERMLRTNEKLLQLSLFAEPSMELGPLSRGLRQNNTLEGLTITPPQVPREQIDDFIDALASNQSLLSLTWTGQDENPFGPRHDYEGQAVPMTADDRSRIDALMARNRTRAMTRFTRGYIDGAMESLAHATLGGPTNIRLDETPDQRRQMRNVAKVNTSANSAAVERRASEYADELLKLLSQSKFAELATLCASLFDADVGVAPKARAFMEKALKGAFDRTKLPQILSAAVDQNCLLDVLAMRRRVTQEQLTQHPVDDDQSHVKKVADALVSNRVVQCRF